MTSSSSKKQQQECVTLTPPHPPPQQAFRICALASNSQTLSAIQASVSRLAFYHSVNDTFAMFASTRSTVNIGAASRSKDQVSNYIRRALHHEASVRSNSRARSMSMTR